MAPLVLIDGHNALHRLGLAVDGDMTRSRGALLARVRRRERGAVVYFDARYAPPDAPEVESERGVRVRYCRRREADEVILERVERESRGGKPLVVTDDRELAGRARQLGARTSSVAAFFAKAPSRPVPPSRPDGSGGFRPEDFGLPDRVDLDDPEV
jgi:hypothetical protein